jgi:hypothetical protein
MIMSIKVIDSNENNINNNKNNSDREDKITVEIILSISFKSNILFTT